MTQKVPRNPLSMEVLSGHSSKVLTHRPPLLRKNWCRKVGQAWEFHGQAVPYQRCLLLGTMLLFLLLYIISLLIVIIAIIYHCYYHCYLSLSVWLYHHDYYCYSNYQLSVSLLLFWSIVLLWLLLVMLFRENNIRHRRRGPQTPGFKAPCRGECSKEPWSLVGATVVIAPMSWDINPTVMARYHIHTYSPSMMNDRYANPQFVAIIHRYVNPEPNNKKTFSQTRVIKGKVPQLVPRHC